MWRRYLACFSVVGLSACGGSSLGKPVAEFPSKEKLEEVAARKATPKAHLKTASVAEWQIATPVPAPSASYPRETHWDQALLAGAAHANAVRPSPALRCAAQEVARFYVEQGAYPDDSLRNFLIARCGSSLPNVQVQVVFSDVPDGTSESALQEGLKKSTDELLQQSLARGGELGVAFAQGRGRATLVALTAKPALKLREFSPEFSGNSVTIAGEAPADVGFVSGFVTQGAYGVKFCEPDRSQKMPTFRLECPIAEQDPEARIELVTGKPNQVFWHLGARVFVRRDAGLGLVYRSTVPEGAQDAAQFRQAFLTSLNEARKAAGVSALSLEAEQSTTNARLAPHFFESSQGGNEWMLDEIGLGLLAGWDVNGMIRSGSILSSFSQSSRNPARFLADALDSPFGRWVLLEPQMSRVAIGDALLEPGGVMALITTYAFFDSQDHRADEASVLEELGKVRQARGLPPLKRVTSDPALRSALGLVASNARPSDEALKEAMERIATERHCGVGGYVLETSDLHHLMFSDQLLSPSTRDVEVGVTHYKARGGAWGQYVILFVTLDDGNAAAPTKSALAAPRVIRAME